MFHPLVADLTKLKDEELTKKIGDLHKRLNQCYRAGPFDLIPQIQMVLQHHMDEQSRRNAKALEEIQKRSNKDGKNFKGIIDIQ
jgi:hypothetical protein